MCIAYQRVNNAVFQPFWFAGANKSDKYYGSFCAIHWCSKQLIRERKYRKSIFTNIDISSNLSSWSVYIICENLVKSIIIPNDYTRGF